MSDSPREIMRKCLKFEHPQRVARDIWLLPWIEDRFPDAVKEIERRFPADMTVCDDVYEPSPRVKGDMYEVGTYVDEWGCVNVNVQAGIIGEVKDPMVKDINDWQIVKPPYEVLPKNYEAARRKVNEFCANTDKFVRGNACARLWERYMYLRGAESALMDMMMPDENVFGLLDAVHKYYLKEMEFWASTDVDCVMFMDDWGAQKQLLIPPAKWREIFKPRYSEYCDIAHSAGKFIFMHSDGCITEIYEDLIDIGVDAINSQLFVMDMAELGKIAKGKITFWGEIDRQHIMNSPNPEDGREAVRKVFKHLYDPSGGIIAHFSFGVGANPDVAIAIYEEWEKLQKERD